MVLKDFYGITASNGGRVMIFAGGIPLKRGGEVLGAVGVSGGMGAQNQAVAEAGAEAFYRMPLWIDCLLFFGYTCAVVFVICCKFGQGKNTF